MKLFATMTAIAALALSSAAFAGGPARVQEEPAVYVPPAPAAAPSSFGAGAMGPGAIAAGVLGVAALAAVLSDDDDNSSTATTTN